MLLIGCRHKVMSLIGHRRRPGPTPWAHGPTPWARADARVNYTAAHNWYLGWIGHYLAAYVLILRRIKRLHPTLWFLPVVSLQQFYHPLSTVSVQFWDQYGNPIFFPYLPSTSHTNLARISAFFVRKKMTKIKPNSPRYYWTDSPCL